MSACSAFVSLQLVTVCLSSHADVTLFHVRMIRRRARAWRLTHLGSVWERDTGQMSPMFCSVPFCICMCLHMCIYTPMTHLHVYLFISIHIHTHISISLSLYTYTPSCISMCSAEHSWANKGTGGQARSSWQESLYLSLSLYICIYIYIYIYIEMSFSMIFKSECSRKSQHSRKSECTSPSSSEGPSVHFHTRSAKLWFCVCS